MSSYIDTLRRWEGLATWMYLDGDGAVNVGIGYQLKGPGEAASLPWEDAFLHGLLLEDIDVRMAYERISGAELGRTRVFYAGETRARLPEALVAELSLKAFRAEQLPRLHDYFPAFLAYPDRAQSALIDLIYAIGPEEIATKGPLRASCEAGRWDAAAVECYDRHGIPARNSWRSEQFWLAAGRR